jgi:hypothetical protein
LWAGLRLMPGLTLTGHGLKIQLGRDRRRRVINGPAIITA